jgi:hypothetical protein
VNAVLVAIGAALALVPFVVVFAFLVRTEGWHDALGCLTWVVILVVWMMAASYLMQTGLGES